MLSGQESEHLSPRHARLALVIGGAAGLTVALLYPYLLVLMPKLASASIPLRYLIPIHTLQGALQLSLLAYIGLRLGYRLGLDAPLLRAWVYRTPPPATAARAHVAVVMGFGVGLVVALLDRFVFMPLQPEQIRALGGVIPAWKGLLASFYGGIGEEVVTRLFLMSLVAWVINKVSGGRGPIVYVAAAAASAIVFGAAHLPAAAAVAPLTAASIARVLALNALCGFPFGLIFWRWGLERAMLAHFSCDIILHVLLT